MRLLLITLLVITSLGLILFNIIDIENAPDLTNSYINPSTPEIETAESYHALYWSVMSTWILEDEDCQDPMPIDALPSHTLYNERGERIGPLELVKFAHMLECDLGNFILARNDAIELIQGRNVSLDDGSILRGSDQLMRAYSTYVAVELFKSELTIGHVAKVEPIPSDKEDPCEAIIDIALNGSTIEIRFAAFYALQNNFLNERGNPRDDDCLKERSDTNEVLIDQTISGDIGSAVNLASRERKQTLKSFWDSMSELARLTEEEFASQVVDLGDSHIASVNEKIAEAAQNSRLLALTYAVGSSDIYMFNVIQGYSELEPIFNDLFERYHIDIPGNEEE